MSLNVKGARHALICEDKYGPGWPKVAEYDSHESSPGEDNNGGAKSI